MRYLAAEVMSMKLFFQSSLNLIILLSKKQLCVLIVTILLSDMQRFINRVNVEFIVNMLRNI